jgi:alcohol dehydrogenase (cytochrome c)
MIEGCMPYAMTGELLWEFPTNSGVEAPPTSFSLDGKQYVAIESGWGGDARGDQGTLNHLFPGEFPEVPERGRCLGFCLP